jgi:hypothetical protein
MQTQLEKATGLTRQELEIFYANKINFLVKMGMQEPEARQTVRELFKKALGL